MEDLDAVDRNGLHRSFAQVAVLDRGKVTEEFRVELDYDAVVAFGQKLERMTKSYWKRPGTPRPS